MTGEKYQAILNATWQLVYAQRPYNHELLSHFLMKRIENIRLQMWAVVHGH